MRILTNKSSWSSLELAGARWRRIRGGAARGVEQRNRSEVEIQFRQQSEYLRSMEARDASNLSLVCISHLI